MPESRLLTPIESLERGLAPLRAWFEEAAGHVRVVGIMSSTCPMCIRGRREGLEPLLAQPSDFRMAWVFIDMMDTDTLGTAMAAATGLRDARLTAFHDPARHLGRAMAHCLGWTQHVAWDTYFIYEPHASWLGDVMPAPAFWYHQLKDREVWGQTAHAEVGSTEWTRCLADKSEADPAHFATGDELRRLMAQAVADAGATSFETGGAATADWQP